MAEDQNKTLDTAQQGDGQALPEVKQGKGAFSKISRELSDNDLKNPAVGRMLLHHNDRYEQQISVLEGYKEKFHVAHTRAEVLAEKLANTQSAINARSLLLVFASLIAGFLPTLWVVRELFWSAAFVSIVLFLMALLKPLGK